MHFKYSCSLCLPIYHLLIAMKIVRALLTLAFLIYGANAEDKIPSNAKDKPTSAKTIVEGPLPARRADWYFDGDRIRKDRLSQLSNSNLDALHRLDKVFETKSLVISATVISVTNAGIIVYAKVWKHAKPNQPPDGHFDDPLFVFGDFPNAVDGSKWKGRVYACGRFQYTSFGGVLRTVDAVATTKELALRYELDPNCR